MNKNEHQEQMEKIVSLCKRRGFFFRGSEIYGGLAGFYDYGPLGVTLKKNIENIWWNMFVEEPTNMFGIDATLVMHPQVYQASGHAANFADPMVEDIKTGKRYRADHLLEENHIDVTGLTPEAMSTHIVEKAIKSPDGNSFGPVMQFNMMFQTFVGATADADSKTFLRPETAQGIFTNYKNVLDTLHPKLPFGIGQIGKAFRNEIAPRDFLFRVREFSQMEVEYFVDPKDWKLHFENFQKKVWEFISLVGIDKSKVSELEVASEDRAHYSERTIDFEFEYPFGKKELYGLAYRTDYDLKNHGEVSKVDLSYFDEERKERFIPHVIEPSFGLERTLLAILASAYHEDEINGETRVYLKLKPEVAPYQYAVFPLLKNKPDLVAKAKEVFAQIKKSGARAMFDDNGNIGKRYRRQDEIGTPYCITIDFDTLDDNTVTIRDRDTGEQKRVKVEDL